MHYEVTGQCRGREVQVTWDNGRLTGDTLAILLVETAARRAELRGIPVGPPSGPYTTENHLADLLSALFLTRELLGDDITATGDVPTVPEIPKGAVA
jgi:hypothetical protein